MKTKSLLGIALATLGLVVGVTMLSAQDNLLNNTVFAANREGNVITCDSGYQTNVDWNISYNEVTTQPQTVAGITATSEIIEGVTQTGGTKTTVWKYGSNSSVGSLELTLTKKINAIGLYATRWQGDKQCSIYVNGTECVLTQDGLLDYAEVERFFVPLAESTNIVTITGQVTKIRFYLYSIGFYSNEDFPTAGGSTPVEPEPETESISLTAANLLNYSSTDISYKDGSQEIDGITFEYQEIGAYGKGIQMRTKSGKSSMIYNTVPFEQPIKQIKITLNNNKYSNERALYFDVGSTLDVEDERLQLDTTSNTLQYTLNLTETNCIYFKLTHAITYSLYVDCIELVF